MTLEAWVYYTCANGSADQAIVTKGWCGEKWSYYFDILDQRIHFGKFNSANCNNSYAEYQSTAQVVPYNTWAHLAIVITGTSVSMYVNGQPVPSSLVTGTAFAGFQACTQPLRIGTYRRLDGAFVSCMLGNIDDVRLWHTARTAAEIATNYNTVLTGNEAGLFCYYKLDETGSGAGITAVNSATATGSTYNGSSVGAINFVNNSTVTNAIPVCSPSLWLRADSTLTKDASNKVSVWNDVSGNNKNATQATALNQPTWMPNVFNGKPAIFFDGANGNYFLENTTQTPVATAGSARTYFIVAKADCNASGYKGGNIFSNSRTSPASTAEFTDNGSGGIYYAGNLVSAGNHPSVAVPFADGQQKIFTGTWRTAGTGNNIDFWMNGIASTTSAGNFVSDNGAAGYAVGDRRDGTANNDFQGYIAEIIVYSRAVSDDERQYTENYLKNKYNNKFIPSQFTNLPVTAKNYNDAVLDDGSWKHSYNSADASKLITSVKDNCLNLGTITDTVYLEPGTYGILPTGEKFLRRHFVIKTQNNPAGTRRVRLYFTIQEFNDLKAVSPGMNTIADLSVTKYEGPTEDGAYHTADATSVTYTPSSAITSGTLFGQYYLEFDVTGFSEFWIHGGATLLPLQPTVLSAIKRTNGAELHWATQNENEITRYEIERSSDANHFALIGNTDAKHDAENNYGFTDGKTGTGIIYYRLRIIKADGTFSYSNTIKLRFDQMIDVSVSPVPANDIISIRSAEKITAVQIFSCSGTLIQSLKANNSGQYNVSDLPNGLYILLISNSAGNQSEKLLIQR